jgi:O-antigen ligase
LTRSLERLPAGAGAPAWRLFLLPLLLADAAILYALPRSPLFLTLLVALIAYVWLIKSPWRALAFAVAGLPFLTPIGELTPVAPGSFQPAFLLIAGPVAILVWNRAWGFSDPIPAPPPAGAGQGAAAGARAGAAGASPGPILSLLSDPIFLWTLLLAAALGVGLLWTPSPWYGGAKFRAYLLNNCVFLVGARLLLPSPRGWMEETIERGYRFLQALAWLLALIAFAGVWNYFSRHYYFIDRLEVLGINAIWMSRLMGAGLLITLALGEARRVPRRLFAVLLLLFAVTFYLGGSRGPLVALAPSLILWFLGARSLRGRSRALRVSVLLGFLLSLSAAFWLFEQGGIESPFSGHWVSNVAREMMLRVAREFLGKAGWLGYGTGGFSQLMKFGDLRFYPHNILLEIWLENGIVGTAFLGGFLVALFLRIRRGRAAVSRGEVSERREILLRLAAVQILFAFVNAQFSGDLPANPWLWLWGGALAAWVPGRAPGGNAASTGG